MRNKENIVVSKDVASKASAIVKTNADELEEWIEAKQRDRADPGEAEDDYNLTPLASSCDEGSESDSNQLKDEKSFEKYFLNQTGKAAVVSSDRTMAGLPRLNAKEYQSLLASYSGTYSDTKQALYTRYEEQFGQWMLELREGFNLMCYGYGSKRELLNNFVRLMVDDGPVIAVNGYFPSLHVKDVVSKVWQVVECFSQLGIDSNASTLENQLASAMMHLNSEESKLRVYLLLHNIDGMNLRNDRAQETLAKLASCSHLHLITSVDHLQSPLLWDSSKLGQFNFVWHDTTTFQPYLEELSYEPSRLIESGQLEGSRGVEFVLSSLTSNSRRVFGVLAHHQLKLNPADARAPKESQKELSSDDEDPVYQDGSGKRQPPNSYASFGLSYTSYYSLCKEKFLVNNDLTFRTLLTEFRDHKIIHHHRSADGTEVLYIPLPSKELEKLCELCS